VRSALAARERSLAFALGRIHALKGAGQSSEREQALRLSLAGCTVCGIERSV